MKSRHLLGLALLLAAAVPALAQNVLIKNATVYTVSSRGTLKNADVLVRGGSIAAVGSNLAAGDAEQIDAKGKPLTPGLFGGLSGIGIEEVDDESQSVDSAFNSHAPASDQQWRPELDLSLAFNPRSSRIPVARVEGITWAMLAPGEGDSIIGGEGMAVTLDGRFEAALHASRSLYVFMGSDGARRSGGSRAAQYLLLEQAIRESKAQGASAPNSLLHPAGREALARYLMGGRVIFQVDRASDILQTLAFARRNGIKPVIWGGSEAWLVGKELAQAQVPVIINPLDDLPESFDRIGATLENAARLQRAGVRIVFSGNDSSQIRLVRQLAGNAVAHGLPWDAALAAITANAASVFGLPNRGKIEVGQVADLVLWSADPLEITSLPEVVLIDGKKMPMRSRQTELRDRYWPHVQANQAR
jgi:hypothetical protein